MKPIDHAQLAAYLSGEIDSPEKERVAAHLENSAEDRAVLDQWRDTLEVLDLWKLDENDLEEEAKVEPGDLAAHLFGEASPEVGTKLERQLKDSREARRTLATWKETLSVLDSWDLEPVRKPTPKIIRFAPRIMKVAAVGTALLGLGFLFGKRSDGTNLAQTRSEWEASLDKKVNEALALRNQAAQDTLASVAETRKQFEEIKLQLATLQASDARAQVLVSLLPDKTEQARYSELRSQEGQKLRRRAKILQESDRINQGLAQKLKEMPLSAANLAKPNNDTPSL